MSDERPPKMVKAQLVRLDDSLKQIERRQVAGIQRAPGSLPVLEAFQAFLENEQRKARRRMIGVTVVALLLMIAAGAAGLFLVHKRLNQASADFAGVTARTDTLVETVDELKRAKDAELLALENRFREESDQIVAQYSSLQKEQQALVDKIGTNRLETLEDRLLRLESENEVLQERLASLTGTADPASIPVSNAMATPLPVNVQSNETAAARSEAPPEAQNTTTNATATVAATDESESTLSVSVIEHPMGYLMTIIPEGQTTAIRWMLPRYLNPE